MKALRPSATLTLLLLLLAASSPISAEIILNITDGADEGYNDPTPVAPVFGNAGTTVGEQRRLVFAAAAAQWATRLVSEVDIFVEASFDPLECEAFSGTLGGAGPTFVIRNSGSFQELPQGSTWYVLAEANAIAGYDVLEPDFGPDTPAIGMSMNSEIGTPGCLSPLAWDYRIGAFITSFGSLSLFNVVLHELAHGFGFLDLVDSTTGEKFAGFNDAYMRFVEDHTLGKRWPLLTDAQRLDSMTNTGLVHFVGRNTTVAAPILVTGSHPSGHVNLYAPDPQEGGSSISHWDKSLFANTDALMEPSLTLRENILLSMELFQDLGWSIGRLKVRDLENVDGLGYADLAILSIGPDMTAKVSVIDPEDGGVITEIPLSPDFSALDIQIVGDFRGTSASEIAVLTTRGSTIRVLLYDALSGELLRTLNFPPGYPRAMMVIPDYASTAADEIAILARSTDFSARLWVKDPLSTSFVSNNKFTTEQPIDIDYVPSFGGGPAPELVVVLNDPTTGTGRIQVRDAATTAVLTDIDLPESFMPQFATAVRHFGNTDAGEIAVLGLTPTGRPEVHIYDTKSGDLLLSKGFADAFLPMGMESVSHFRITGSEELAVFGRRFLDQKTKLVIFDAKSGVNINNTAQPVGWIPRSFAVIESRAGGSADDVVIMSTIASDGIIRAYIKDAAGTLLRVFRVQ